MKIDVHTHNWNEVDILEIAQLLLVARRASPSFVVLARARGKLVGMTGIITTDPILFDLWR